MTFCGVSFVLAPRLVTASGATLFFSVAACRLSLVVNYEWVYVCVCVVAGPSLLWFGEKQLGATLFGLSGLGPYRLGLGRVLGRDDVFRVFAGGWRRPGLGCGRTAVARDVSRCLSVCVSSAGARIRAGRF
jgi:hypothetical protein